MHYHQIIVGQGIAGSLLAYQLLKLNQQLGVLEKYYDNYNHIHHIFNILVLYSQMKKNIKKYLNLKDFLIGYGGINNDS